MTRKQKRLATIGSLGAVLAVALGLILYALSGQISFFYSPSQAKEASVAAGTAFRLGGLVDLDRKGLTQRLVSAAVDAAVPAGLRDPEGNWVPLSLRARVILVSNEVGLGIVPDNAMARMFRDLAGSAHQRLAEICDDAYFVVAGLPMVLAAPLLGEMLHLPRSELPMLLAAVLVGASLSACRKAESPAAGSVNSSPSPAPTVEAAASAPARSPAASRASATFLARLFASR